MSTRRKMKRLVTAGCVSVLALAAIGLSIPPAERPATSSLALVLLILFGPPLVYWLHPRLSGLRRIGSRDAVTGVALVLLFAGSTAAILALDPNARPAADIGGMVAFWSGLIGAAALGALGGHLIRVRHRTGTHDWPGDYFHPHLIRRAIAVDCVAAVLLMATIMLTYCAIRDFGADELRGWMPGLQFLPFIVVLSLPVMSEAIKIWGKPSVRRHYSRNLTRRDGAIAWAATGVTAVALAIAWHSKLPHWTALALACGAALGIWIWYALEGGFKDVEA